jgi:hypothetical protein
MDIAAGFAGDAEMFGREADELIGVEGRGVAAEELDSNG